MQFLFPTFLFALAALAIPIIIHLFYFRRFKTVYFTNVRFLREVKEESSSRRKLRNFLVLLMRCLAVAFLVFAFAQPFIPRNTEGAKKREQAASIFIDNSFSMNALSRDVSLLEKAKMKAREIVQAYSNSDKFQILTNDFEGRHQRLVSKEEALNFIDEIKMTPSVTTGFLTIENGESVEIYNHFGQLVFVKKLNAQIENINISSLSSGQYIVCIKNGFTFFSKRIVLVD